MEKIVKSTLVMMLIGMSFFGHLNLSATEMTEKIEEMTAQEIQDQKDDVIKDEDVSDVQDNKIDLRATTYRITFETSGGTPIAAYEDITHGTQFYQLNEIEIPTRGGNERFYGWYTDEELTTEMNRYDEIKSDLTLYAKWTNFVDESLFSDEMIRFLTEEMWLELPFDEATLQEVEHFSDYYETYNGDGSKMVVLQDLRGIEFLPNISDLKLGVSLTETVSVEKINELSKLQKIARVEFEILTPDSVNLIEWGETESFYDEVMATPAYVKKIEDNILNYILNLNYEVDADNYRDAVEIVMGYSITLYDFSFLEPVNNLQENFFITRQTSEIGRTLYLEPTRVETTSRDGETTVRYKLEMENPFMFIFENVDRKYEVDTERLHQELNLYEIVEYHFFDDMDYDDLDELNQPFEVEYMDENGDIKEYDSSEVEPNFTFENLYIYLSEAQYNNLLRQFEEGIHSDDDFVNKPYGIMKVNANSNIRENDMESQGGNLRDDNFYYYDGIRLVLKMSDDVQTYEVKYNANEGTGSVPATTDNHKKDDVITVVFTPLPTREGYTFDGWNDGETTYKAPEDGSAVTFIMKDVDVELRAMWRLNPVTSYKVDFESNGGTEVASETGLFAGSKVTQPTEPIKVGYTFAGWYQESSLTTAWSFDHDTISGNTTLYAKWLLNQKPPKPEPNPDPKPEKPTTPKEKLVQTGTSYLTEKMGLLSFLLGAMLIRVNRKK